VQLPQRPRPPSGLVHRATPPVAEGATGTRPAAAPRKAAARPRVNGTAKTGGTGGPRRQRAPPPVVGDGAQGARGRTAAGAPGERPTRGPRPSHRGTTGASGAVRRRQPRRRRG
jgi:hypothetical protein